MSCLESKYQQSGSREINKLCIQMQLLRAVFQVDDVNLTLIVNVFAQESFREADLNQRGVIDMQSFEVSCKEVGPYVDLPRPWSFLNGRSLSNHDDDGNKKPINLHILQ